MKKIISAVAAMALCAAVQTNAFASDGFPPHEPYGEGVGAMPGRVVWSYEPSSVDWDGNGYWWELENFDEGVIRKMVSAALRVRPTVGARFLKTATNETAKAAATNRAKK